MIIVGVGVVAFLLFILQRLVYINLWDKHLSVSVSFLQDGITEGESGEVMQVLENRKRLLLPMVRVGFQTAKYLRFENEPGSITTDQYYHNEIFQINGYEKITRRLKFQAEKRGYYHINNIDVAGTDLFFVKEAPYSMSTDSYLYVYPKVFRSEEFLSALQKLSGDILVQRHIIEDPFEYRGIREYQPFDDMRAVNWKATAKVGELKVNQRNYTAMQTVRIFLNTEDADVWKKYREMEMAMQIVLGIAERVIQQGIRVAFYTNGRDQLTQEPIAIEGGAGITQLEAIRKALARIDTSQKAAAFVELFREKARENVTESFNIFVSPNAYLTFQELLCSCETERIEYRWFYPILQYEKDEALKQITDSKVLAHTQFVPFK